MLLILLELCGRFDWEKTCWVAFCPGVRAVKKIANDTGIM